jgi:hypothetical protein
MTTNKLPNIYIFLGWGGGVTLPDSIYIRSWTINTLCLPIMSHEWLCKEDRSHFMGTALNDFLFWASQFFFLKKESNQDEVLAAEATLYSVGCEPRMAIHESFHQSNLLSDKFTLFSSMSWLVLTYYIPQSLDYTMCRAAFLDVINQSTILCSSLHNSLSITKFVQSKFPLS